MPAHTALDLMEEISQLHEDHQACHGQPDVSKQLFRVKTGRMSQKVKYINEET